MRIYHIPCSIDFFGKPKNHLDPKTLTHFQYFADLRRRLALFQLIQERKANVAQSAALRCVKPVSLRRYLRMAPMSAVVEILIIRATMAE